MRIPTIASLAFALVIPGHQAITQDKFVQGKRAQGELRFGGFRNDDLSTGYLFGDLTLSMGRGAWAVNLEGFGVVGRLHESYFDISYSGDSGTLLFGFPRPAYDLVASSALTHVEPRLTLENIGVSRSRATFGTMTQSKYLPYGATYQIESGALLATASLHSVPDYDTVIAGFGAQRMQGNITYAGAFEAVFEGDDLGWNWKAQVESKQDGSGFTVTIFDGAANDAPVTVELGASAPISPRFSAHAVARYDDAQVWGVQFGGRRQIADALSLVGSMGSVAGNANADIAVAYNF